MNEEQLKGLKLYEKLIEAFPNENAYFEINSINNDCTVRIHGINNLVKAKRIIGVPKLIKENLSESQYAYADIGNIHITIYAKDLFYGCKLETTTEEKLVPAQTEHYETITHKKIICGKDLSL